jgi:hypothetical protein
VFRAFISVLRVEKPTLRITFDVSDNEDAVGFAVDLARRHKMSVVSILTSSEVGRRLAVVRLQGTETETLLEEIWQSGHRVLDVRRPPAPVPDA